jgi:hypothetical protein
MTLLNSLNSEVFIFGKVNKIDNLLGRMSKKREHK